MKHNIKNENKWPLYLLFPLVTFYYEIIFKIVTSGRFSFASILIVLLFSACYGAIGYLLASIFKSQKANRIITIVLLSLTAIPFLIEYFVFRAFKIYYDINTIVGGAGGVATGFAAQTFELILSFSGIAVILIYALPIVLYCIFGKKLIPARCSDMIRRIIAGFMAVFFFVIGFVAVKCSKYSDKYGKEYTFQDAVPDFGLVTGLRLDISHIIFKTNSSGEFEKVEKTKKSKKAVETNTKPVEYGYNKMDIDFETLKSTESNRTVQGLHDYVSSLTPSKKNKYTGIFKGKNLIFITAEAFSAEVIDENLTPTLYRLATKGINFTDYYQPASAGTTGGEYQNLLGMLPSQEGRSFKNSATHNLYFTMGNQLNRLGYYGKAFHNNSYTFYDRNKTHINLGYSDGFMGYGNGMEQYVTNCWPQSDLEMLVGTLPTYIDKEHFNIYYMSVSGHSGYSRSGNTMTDKNWDFVDGLSYSDKVKGYLAANIELDRALEYTLKQLEEKGKINDTVICISADHFPYGLDDGTRLGDMPYLAELYGFTPTNNLQRDHNRLILWCGSLEKEKPIVVSAPTFSLDILPTLQNLFGLEFDSRFMVGRDVFSDADALVFNSGYDWKTELGTYISSSGKFTPASETTVVPEGYVENVKSIVRNKIKYCSDVLSTDYFAHVFK